MSMTRIRVKNSIPVHPNERLSVKNGDGRVVETWIHIHSDKWHHHYIVEGYSNSL